MKLRLKQIRKERGLSQQALATLAGMSPSYYADLERGDKQANARRIEGIAKALGVEPVDLIESDVPIEDVKMRTQYDGLDEDQKVLVRHLVASLAAKGK
jgi:transcriptional regulator with XRE-family HTH domain